jgi:hypothetical protein
MSGWYGRGKQRLALDVNWDEGTYYAVAIDEADYTYSRSHATLENANIPTAARQGTPVALTGKTCNADGELDCDDIVMTGLAQGQDTIEAVLIYEEAAAADASRYPLLYINGLNLTPNGATVTFQVASSSPYLGRL